MTSNDELSPTACLGTTVFRDDFDHGLDSSVWRAGLYWGFTNPANNELQTYSDDLNDGLHYEVSDGTLKLKASLRNGVYTSAALTVDTSTPTFTEGCYEMRARFPHRGAGTWPAFWLATWDGGVDAARRPEIDIVEHIGTEPHEAKFAAHYLTPSGSKNQTSGSAHLDSPGDFHTYSARWSSTGITWFVDGAPVHETSDTTDQPFFLHLNLAIGGWGGSPDPELFADGAQPVFEIDYVAVTR